MSRNKKFKNEPNTHENCIHEQATGSSRDRALKLLKMCKERESKRKHEIVIIDAKTYLLKEV